MARPSKIGARYKVNVQLSKYDYDFLERNATKFKFSKSEVIRQIIATYREYNYDKRVVATLEDAQVTRLTEIANTKNMSVGELASKVISNYIDTYF